MRLQECEPNPSVGGKCARARIFEGEIRNKARSMLLLAVGIVEDGKTGHIEYVFDEVGCSVSSCRPESDNHLTGWE